MKNKNINKYKYLDETVFSLNCPHDFFFTYKGKKYSILWDHKNDLGYIFIGQINDKRNVYKTIYEALDCIKFDGKSLREMLLTTDFDFDDIQ